MQQDSRRSLILIVMLAAALLVMAALYGRDFLQNRILGQTPGYSYVTDIDRWRKTQREHVVHARYDFSLGPQLHDIPLQIGDWQGEDMPQDNVEVQILLEPEEYVYRRYRRADGKTIWLSIIGSRQAKSFHPPQICYDAAGWSTEVSSVEIPLQKGSIYAMQVEAEKEAWTHIALYFFLFPDYLRDQSQGVILFKVTSPLAESKAATLDVQRNFIRQFFTAAH